MADLIPKRKLAFGQFTFVSSLTPAECASRLAAAIRSPSSTLLGSAREKRFRVAWRYPFAAINVRNSFKPYLFGKLRASDGGTTIRCHFTFHPLVIGLFLWVMCLGTVAAVMVHVWTFVVVPLVILIVGAGISWGERELLVQDVMSALNARPTSDDRSVREAGQGL